MEHPSASFLFREFIGIGDSKSEASFLRHNVDTNRVIPNKMRKQRNPIHAMYIGEDKITLTISCGVMVFLTITVPDLLFREIKSPLHP